MSELGKLGDEPFVSLTTYRRSGQGVATPVWLARDGNTLIVLTPQESHKVGRVRCDPRVQLAPSTRSGRVREDAPQAAGTAHVVTDPDEVKRLRALIAGKYGWQYRAVMLAERLAARRSKPRVILSITLPSRP
jgi:PPOX class probable F420-dependent enzyme